jgi:vitamin B12 transporter
MKKRLFFILAVFLSGSAFAEDSVDLGTIVISPTRLSESKYSVGKSVDVLGPDETVNERIIDGFVTIPGVRVKQANGLGGLTTIRVRGLRSIDTKLMVDGLPLRDPSDPQGSANPLWLDLMEGGIGRTEITRGTGSALYGSDAQAGVVALYTKRGHGAPRANGGFEYGSRGTFREYIETEGVSKGFDFYNRLGRTDSDGIDAHDGYGNTSFNSRLGYSWDGGARIETTFLGYNADGALKHSPLVIGGVTLKDSADENDRRENELRNYGVHLSVPISESINLSSRIGYTDSARRFQFLPNEDGTGFYNDGGYKGQNLAFDEQLDFIHNDNLTTTIGYQHETEWQTIFAKSIPGGDQELQSRSGRNEYFAQERIGLFDEKWVSTIGARQSNPDHTKSRATWDAATSLWVVPGTHLKAHYGTAYRAPSLYEKHGAFLTEWGTFNVGNPTLSPERSTGYDFGAEQNLSEDILVGSTYFRHDLISQIDFVGFGYENIGGQGHTWGVESFADWKPADGLKARVSHTYTQALAEGTGSFDIPKNQWGGEVEWKSGKFTAWTRGTYIGPRTVGIFNLDTFLTDKIHEDAFVRVDAGASYEIAKAVQVYGRIENIFDEGYTESGFRTPGLGVFGGVRTEF